MKNVRVLIIFSLVFVIAGCAQVAQLKVTGSDTYQLTKRSRIAIGSGSDLLSELYVEASQYCQKKEKKMIPVADKKHSAIPGIQFASAFLEFGCK